MKVVSIRNIPGPNIFHNESVSVMTLDLEEHVDSASDSLPDFVERLLALLPGLKEHRCSPGYPGGFVERLHRGTYLAHIVEHIALELSGPAGISVGYGKTIYGGEPRIYKVIVRAKSDVGMNELLRMAVAIAESLLRGDSFPVSERLEEVKHLIRRNEFGPSTRALVAAAEARGIPWARLNDQSLVQLGYGKNRRILQAALSGRTSAIAVETVADKELTSQLLREAFIPVPKSRLVDSEDDAVEAMGEFNLPVVIKPQDGNHGRGVSLNLSNEFLVRNAFRLAREHGRGVLIEEQFVGKDYRVLVIAGKLVAASERMPANVVGDGSHNVAELIALENRNPLRGDGHGRPLTKIEVDDTVISTLKLRATDLTDVPRAGERIFLRDTANLSTGGTAKDVTDEVHPEVRRLCERAARILDLDICGIDLILPDIARPMPSGGCGIIEMNAGPGLRMHHFPSEGKPRDAGGAIIDMLYPPGTSARIPLISITGTNGKTTVTRLTDHVIRHAGKVVGMTTTDGIYVDGERIARGDTTGPASARAILTDPNVEVAVLETARGGIARRGLGYDWSDIGVITNVQPDHIGQDGIETIEDLLRIKSLVAERVKENGTLVLNADDERLGRLMENPRLAKISRRVVFFSLRENNPVVQAHVNLGGTAFFARDGVLLESNAGAEGPLIAAAEIPITFGGTAEFQIANILAAVAACRAYGISREVVVAGLRTFNVAADNRGRANVYQVGRGSVILDYGHNPEAYRAISKMTAQWNRHTVTGIIGVPGDRADDLIRESGGVVAEGFDRIIVREDKDPRGRPRGEAARILCGAIHAAGNPNCRIVLDEIEALDQALAQMRENEVTVLFFDHDLEPVMKLLKKYNAREMAGLPDVGPAVTTLREVG